MVFKFSEISEISTQGGAKEQREGKEKDMKEEKWTWPLGFEGHSVLSRKKWRSL